MFENTVAAAYGNHFGPTQNERYYYLKYFLTELCPYIPSFNLANTFMLLLGSI